MTDLVDLTISDAAGRLRRREISSVELTEAILRRIAATEDRIHAYVHLYGDEARAAAAERDREGRTGHWRGPLHGVPVAIKDLLATADAPTEAGSEALKGTQTGYDAAVVERLHAAGAVIVGKTVTHELAYGVNTPPTRNPWGSDHYPGGSSAGSGAALAARSALGAIGTDTGGSIREPAALNGLTGLKPTFGRVSRYGVFPLSSSLDHVGPMTRSVQDCALLLGAIAGYDARDGGSIDEPVPDYLRGIGSGIRDLRIGVERDYFFGRSVTAPVRAAVEAVIAELGEAGAEVIEVSIPELPVMSPVGLTILLAEASAAHHGLLRERGGQLHPQTRIMLELGELVPATHYVEAVNARSLLKEITRRTFQAHGLDLLLSPTLPSPTVAMDALGVPDENGEDPLTTAINLCFPANVTGLPALTIPCGFSPDGFPIGVQLMGRPFDEATLFRAALTYERNHDWIDRSPPGLT
jgi:aspartyl-tRNA(Asn)/glutamyl-tRNA(Gln) amidotransferase subunit A